MCHMRPAVLTLSSDTFSHSSFSRLPPAVDDIMQTMHHLVSVSDSEHLMCAQQFADTEGSVDEETCSYLDREWAISGNLHAAASKPKGCTYGRKRQPRDRQQRVSRWSGDLS